MKHVFILLIITIFISCTSSNDDNDALKTDVYLKDQVSNQLALPFGNPEKVDDRELISDYNSYKETDPQKKVTLRSEGMNFFKEAVSISNPIQGMIAEKETFNDADQLIQMMDKHFEANRDKRALYISKQMIGTFLIQKIFPNLSEEMIINPSSSIQINQNELKLIEYSIKLLAENGNPNADLISFCLFILKDHLTRDEIVRYAQLSYDNAVRWENEQDDFFSYSLKANNECKDCETEITELLKEIHQQDKRVSIKTGKLKLLENLN